jgi:hypothetical protein
MSFGQAYYTSCEKGLLDKKGFQFKAVSADIEPLHLSQIERLGLYVPPLSAPSRPTPEELQEFPVSLAFQSLGDGGAVLRQAKYVGLDYTGRYGNFFTHSLVSQNPHSDFCQTNQLLPIDAWRSGTWAEAGDDCTELPIVEKILPGADIHPQSVLAFLQEPTRRKLFPNFLTAVVEAIKTNRRVILVDDNANIAFWIAAASYALPYRFVMKLSFNTYVRDPYETEALITGTTDDTIFNFATHEIDHQFFVFDLKGSRFTAIERPSGFAAKVGYACQNNYPVSSFAGFVEASAPDLSAEELEDAFAAYCYFENFELPEVDDVEVLAWSAKYLKKLADKDFQTLLRKVINQSPIQAKILQAATEFYLAMLDAKLDAPVTEGIRLNYFQWLISEAIRTADVPALAATARALPREAYDSEHSDRLREGWLKNLRDSGRPDRFAVALLVGDKLGFALKDSSVLSWLGTDVSEKWGADKNIQRAFCEVATQPGGKLLIEGMADNLAGKINEVNLFSSLSTMIEDRVAFAVLAGYAVKSQNLPLYLRLRGTQSNLASRPPERTGVLAILLNDVERIFDIRLTPEILQAAFSAVWLNSTPTLEEAQQLLSPPLLDVVKNTDLPQQLVDVLGTGGKFSGSQPEIDLLDRLLSSDVFENLGDKATLVTAYAMAAELLGKFTDPDGTRVEEYFNWLVSAVALKPEIVAQLYRLLGQKSARVENERTHVRLLSAQLRRKNDAFLEGYDAESQTILKTKKNNSAVVLLMTAWMSIASRDQQLIRRHLLNWIEVLEQNKGKREVEEIEASLVPEHELYRMWLILKEERRKNRPGLWGRIAGNVFTRR